MAIIRSVQRELLEIRRALRVTHALRQAFFEHHVILQYEGIHLGCRKTAIRLFRPADHRFPTHVEAGVDDNGAAGQPFERLTGCAVIVNTSFNVRGEPMVCRPEQAYRCFAATEMDALVLENYVVLKERLPERVRDTERAAYLEQFALD